jgi:hypothetical protein
LHSKLRCVKHPRRALSSFSFNIQVYRCQHNHITLQVSAPRIHNAGFRRAAVLNAVLSPFLLLFLLLYFLMRNAERFYHHPGEGSQEGGAQG